MVNEDRWVIERECEDNGDGLSGTVDRAKDPRSMIQDTIHPHAPDKQSDSTGLI
jgi:hypothetical protein